MSDEITVDSIEEPEYGEELARLMSGGVAIKAGLSVDVMAIEEAIEQRIHELFVRRLDAYINKAVDNALGNAYGAQHTFKDALQDAMSKKLDEKYPGIVDEKVDELAETIKGFKFEWNRREEKQGLQKKALEKVDAYIENELAAEVKKQADWLEQYSRNYFAHNLFRAMGMMDKMIPLADAEGAPKVEA